MPVLDDAWIAWLNENVRRGCSADAMVDAMVWDGFNPADAWAALLSVAADNLPKAAATAVSSGYVYDALPIASGNHIDAGDRMVDVVLRLAQPQVLVFANVLSDAECDEVVARSLSRLKRSTTVNPLTGQEDVIDRRTSDGTFFRRCEDAFISRLDQRIARLMAWPLEHGEGLQILRYGVGGEYRPHFDYFPPSDPGSAAHLERAGQRVATLVVYLNDVAAGGETVFPEAGLSVAPRKGSAVYFRYGNQLGQLDPMTLHGGAPVLAGEKWIMTKWMRQHRYG
jgi:prolyl 4-hydroxylase